MVVSRIGDLFAGWDFSGKAVALARATLEVAVLGALAFLGTELDDVLSWIPNMSPQNVGIGMTSGFWVLRQAEGWVDDHIDPTQNRKQERVADPRPPTA